MSGESFIRPENDISPLFGFRDGNRGSESVGDNQDPSGPASSAETILVLEGVSPKEVDDADLESIKRELRHYTVMDLSLPVQEVRVKNE